MHFDTLPLTDAICVAYCEPRFDLGQMYQEITMPERGSGNDTILRVLQRCHRLEPSLISITGCSGNE